MRLPLLAPPKVPQQRAEQPVLAGAARGGIANLIGACVAGTAGVGITWMVARGLGPVGAGSFFAATSAFVLFGSIARLGTTTALVYWPARLRALGRTELIGSCLRAGLVPVAALSIVLGGGLWLLAPKVFPDFAAPLRALAFFLPLAALSEALLAATRGHRLMRPTVLLDRITKPGAQLFGIALLFLVSSAAVQLWTLVWVLPYVVVFTAAALIVSRLAPPSPSIMRLLSCSRHCRGAEGDASNTACRDRNLVINREIDGKSVSREFWRFTAPRALASGAQTALQRVDVLMVASLAGLAPAAAYAVAGRFIVVGQLAGGAISQSVQPRLAESLATKDHATAARLYQGATAWLVLLSWPLHLSVLTHASVYLGLFGAEYAEAAAAVRVLAIGMLIATGCGMVDIVLSMAGRTTWNLYNVLLALLVMVTVDLLTIPSLGVLGAAIGLAAAVTVNNVLPLAQLGISLRLHPFGAATVTAMLLASFSFLVVPALVPNPPAGFCAAVAVYALGLRLLRDRLGLDVVLNALRNRRG